MDAREKAEMTETDVTASPEKLLIWKDRSNSALKALANSVAGAKPVIVLTGTPGSGKTTFLQAVKDRVDPAISLIDITVGDGQVETLVAAISDALQLKAKPADAGLLETAVRTHLFDTDSAGRKLVLTFDQADRLSPKALELVIALARINRKDRHLMNVVLAGSSELFDAVTGHIPDDGTDLIDAISVPALTRASSIELINQELADLSGGDVTIADAACTFIYRESNGVPGPTISTVAALYAAAKKAKIDKITARNIHDLLSADVKDVPDGKSEAKAESLPKVAPLPKSPGMTANMTSKPQFAATAPTNSKSSGSLPSKTAAPTPAAQKEASPNKTSGKSGNGTVSDLVRGQDKLPQSIRETKDPQLLLRWAMGIQGDEQTTGPNGDPPITARPPAAKTVEKKPKPKSEVVDLPGAKNASKDVRPIDPPLTAPPKKSTAKPSEPVLRPITPPPVQSLNTAASSRDGKASSANQALGSSEQFVFDRPAETEPAKSLVVPLERPTATPPLAAPMHVQKDKPSGIPMRWVAAGVALGALLGGGASMLMSGPWGGEEPAILNDTVARNVFDPSADLMTSFATANVAPTPQLPVTLPPVYGPTRLDQPAMAEPARNAGLENVGTIAAVTTDQTLSAVNQQTAQESDISGELANLQAQATALREQVGQLRQESNDLTQSNAAAELDLNRNLANLEEASAALNNLVTQVDQQQQTSIESERALIATNTAAATQRDQLTAEVTALEGQLAALQEQVASERSSLTDVAAELESQRALLDQNQDATSAAQQALNVLASDTQVSAEELSALQNQRAALNEELASLEALLADRSAQAGEQTSTLEGLAARVADQETQLSSVTQELDAARAALASVETRRADQEALFAQKQVQLDDTQTALEAATSELAANERAINAQSNDLTGAQSEVAELFTTLETLRGQEQSLRQELAALEPQLEQSTARTQSLDAQVARKANDLADSALLAENMRDELALVVSQTDLAVDELRDTQNELQERRAQLVALREELRLAAVNAAAVAPEISESVVATLPSTAPNAEPEADVIAALEPPNLRSNATAERVLTGPESFQPRNAEQVAQALSRAPGLRDLAPNQFSQLETKIVEGACLTDALKETTGQINRHTLATLLRTLDLCTTN